MELRDEFAREAMKEIKWTADPEYMKVCAKTCYAIADAMMVARGTDWIKWPGGDCPLPGDVDCDVRFSNGNECLRECADSWDWGHTSGGLNIVAYRVST